MRGDILLIEEGDTIPADARLIQSTSLQTAEAALTGESLPVSKDTDPVNAEVTMVPQTTVKLVGKDAEAAVKLVNILEDNEDVQNVFSNMDVEDSVLESVG